MLNRLRRRVALARAKRAVRDGRSDGGSRPGVDVEALLALARQSFVCLQAAWDQADLRTLEAFTTEPLMADLRAQLAQRGPTPNRTEVLALQARLLAVEEIREAFIASVEFSGVIREHVGAAACPFREMWLLAQHKAEAPPAQDHAPPWRIAGVQSLS